MGKRAKREREDDWVKEFDCEANRGLLTALFYASSPKDQATTLDLMRVVAECEAEAAEAVARMIADRAAHGVPPAPAMLAFLAERGLPRPR